MIFVIDSADKKRLFMAKEMVTRVSKDPNMAGVPFLFMLNKQDLEAEKMTTGEIEVELNLVKLFAEGVFRI